MLILRCTQKLLKRLGAQVTEQPSGSTTILGDWYANVVSLPFRGKSVVLFVNEPTRLAILIPGRGSQKVVPVFQDRVEALLRRLDLPEGCIEHEAREMAEVQLGRTASRSVLGSMNDIAHYLKYEAEAKGSAEAVDWDEAEMKLSERLHGPLEYEYPKTVAAERCRAWQKDTA